MSAQRIITIVTHLGDGGAQYLANTIGESLEARGHHVELWFLYRKQRDFPSRIPWSVVWPATALRATDYPGLVGSLVQRLRDAAADAVISHLPLANCLGQMAARVAGVRTRMAVQHTESWTYKPAIRWLDALVGSTGFYTSNIAVSETVRKSFSNRPASYRRHMQVVQNGVVFEPSELSQSQARNALHLPQSCPLIVAVGRLSEQKNHALLVHALSAIPEAHLAIAGDGELRPMLTGLAQSLGVTDRLHLLGNVSSAQVAMLMRAGDIWAFPSLYEGLSLSLLEAVNAGIPIVASSIPSNAEVLSATNGEVAGVLLDPGDQSGWRRELSQLSQDPSLRRSYVARTQALAPLFSLERMIDQYESVLCSGTRR